MAWRGGDMGDALWPARVVVRWLDGLLFKAKSCVLASPLLRWPSLPSRTFATGSFAA
jgi:hypothetical protein